MGHVTHSREGHVATVVLANAARHNAMSIDMWRQLAALLSQLQADPSVRAVVLRGEGDRAFVSGADISEFGAERSTPQGVQAYDKAVDDAQAALANFPRPVIAAISGICYGGGLGLALACDMRYGAPTARFRMPAARLGLGYALNGVQRMVDVLGASNASELFYTARVCDAPEALRVGLLNGVHEDCFAYAADVAAQIAANAPLTIVAAKLAITALRRGQADSAASSVAQAVKACFESADYVEGRQAFAEKRPPRFTGR